MKNYKRILAVALVVILVASSFSVYAENRKYKNPEYKRVYDLRTGETLFIDVNNTEEEIVTVRISMQKADAETNGTKSRVYAGRIVYNVTSTLAPSVTTTVDCYQNPTCISSNGNTLEYSHLWTFINADTGNTYTMYGNLGYTKYVNAQVVEKNYYSPANWGITTGDYALANNFYSTNPEYFGGSTNAFLVSFVYG